MLARSARGTHPGMRNHQLHKGPNRPLGLALLGEADDRVQRQDETNHRSIDVFLQQHGDRGGGDEDVDERAAELAGQYQDRRRRGSSSSWFGPNSSIRRVASSVDKPEVGGLPAASGGAEAAGFEEVDDRVGHPALAQAIGGGQHLLELVGVHRREHDLLAGDVLAGPGEPDRAFGKQLRAFRWREQGRNLAAFGYHEGPQLSIGLKHASQHGRRRVRVGHEHDAGDVAGLGEHGLGHGRVLSQPGSRAVPVLWPSGREKETAHHGKAEEVLR